VKNMRVMFYYNSSFNQDISYWDVSEVTDMGDMLASASSFNQDLSAWDVDKVTFCNDFSVNSTIWTKPKPTFTNCIE
jgi:surface protein